MTRPEYETALAILTAEAAAGRGDLRQGDYPDAQEIPPFRSATLHCRARREALTGPVVAAAELLRQTGGSLTAIIYRTDDAEIQIAISRDLDADEIAAARQAAQPPTIGGAV